MTTATATADRVPEAPPTETPAWVTAPAAPEPRPPFWVMPAAAVPVAALVFLWGRRRARKRRAMKTPSADWSLFSRNTVTFSPRLNFHPALGRSPGVGAWRLLRRRGRA